MHASRYFKLGLFILIGVGMLVAAVLVLGAGRLLEKHVQAETVMDEAVSGLDVGSPVEYRGVKIGRVTSIEFTTSRNGGAQPNSDRIARYVLIEMSLDSRAFKGMNLQAIRDTLAQMARNGLRARIAQQGLAGGVHVGLDYVDIKSNPPPPLQWKSNALYIPSAPSTMTQVMSAADRLASDLRQANLPAVVEHIDTLVTSATGTVRHVDQIVEANRSHLNSALADLPSITGRLKTTTGRLDAIVHDDRLEKTLGNVSDDSANAGATLHDLRETVQDLRTLIATQQGDIQRIIVNLRRTTDNLAALSGDARENPSRLLLGGPPAEKPPGQ